jgi:hypothetical protein
MTWYRDPEGEYWRHSKRAGGLQAEDADNGTFGAVMALSDAIEQFGVEQLPHAEGLVLDQFDKIRVAGMDYRAFRALRDSMLRIVQFAMQQRDPEQIEHDQATQAAG